MKYRQLIFVREIFFPRAEHTTCVHTNGALQNQSLTKKMYNKPRSFQWRFIFLDNFSSSLGWVKKAYTWVHTSICNQDRILLLWEIIFENEFFFKKMNYVVLFSFPLSLGSQIHVSVSFNSFILFKYLLIFKFCFHLHLLYILLLNLCIESSHVNSHGFNFILYLICSSPTVSFKFLCSSYIYK